MDKIADTIPNWDETDFNAPIERLGNSIERCE
jgi:hypothetical protein